jgi:predicted MFS family arabinose efflux permease
MDKSPRATEWRTPGNRPLALALGGLLSMAAGIGVGRFVYTPILPPMVEALDLSKSEAGLIASANFVGYLAGALLASWPGLPGSRRGWLLGGLAATALALAAMGATTSLTLFLLLRLIAGVASAFALVFGSALVLDRLARAGRSSLSAVHFAGVGSGIALSAAIVALMLAQGAAWQSLWFASAAITLVAAVAVAVLVPPEDKAPPAVTAIVAPERSGFGLLSAAYGLFGFGYVITATFLMELIREAPALAPLEPYAWILVGLAAAPSVALWGALARRWGILTGFAAAAVIEAVGVACSVLFLSTTAIVIAAILLGGTFMGLTALGLMAARERGHGDPRARIALVTAVFGAGQIIGPAFAGYAYDATGSLLIPTLAASAALLVAAALALAASRR